MHSSAQLPLPLSSRPALSRADLIVARANEEAVAFIDAWPDWPTAAAALYGPAGSGKTHLVSIWRDRSGAHICDAAELSAADVDADGALAIENVDAAPVSAERDATLFAALETDRRRPLLLTGRTPPAHWPCVLPDLASRFAAIAAVALKPSDEALLAEIARKLFADRQIPVTDAVIAQMLRLIERSPGAVRDFVAEADAAALAAGRPVSIALIRALIAAGEAELRNSS